MANIFVISDSHFSHANILTFTRADRRICAVGEAQCDEACKAEHPGLPLRIFPSVEAMDEHMIERWNAVVRPQDKVYHLGDVVMQKRFLPILERLHGHLRLVRGNHDIFPTAHYLKYFDEVYGSRVLDNILFTHIPVHTMSLGRFRGNVHGHLHNNTVQLPLPYYNVSVEMVDYTPVSLEDLKQRLGAPSAG